MHHVCYSLHDGQVHSCAISYKLDGDMESQRCQYQGMMVVTTDLSRG